jgi:hypothetical protein
MKAAWLALAFALAVTPAIAADAAADPKAICEKQCTEECQLGHKPNGNGYWFCEAPITKKRKSLQRQG